MSNETRLPAGDVLTEVEGEILRAQRARAERLAAIRNEAAEAEAMQRAISQKIEKAEEEGDVDKLPVLRTQADAIRGKIRKVYAELNEALDQEREVSPVNDDDATRITSAALRAYRQQDRESRKRCIELVKELYKETVEAEIVTDRVNRILRTVKAGQTVEVPFFVPWARTLVRDGRYTIISGEVSPEVSQEGAAQ